MIKVKKPVQDFDVEKIAWYQGTDREIFGPALCDVGGTSKVGFGLVAPRTSIKSDWFAHEYT